MYPFVTLNSRNKSSSFLSLRKNLLCSKRGILPQRNLVYAESSYLCPLVFEVSLEEDASEIAEELIFLDPIHLWCFLLFFGMDLHLFLCCRSAQTQAHLSIWVQQPGGFIVRQLDRRYVKQRQVEGSLWSIKDQTQ